MTEFYVKVRTGKNSFRVQNGQVPEVHLKAEAENNRANSELKRRMEDVLGEKPGIISGHKKRRKKLKVSIPEEKIRRKLEDLENG